MSPELNKAFLVLVVGMITVFIILLLVVITGKLLIRFVNRYFPVEEKENSPPIKPAPVFQSIDGIPANKMAAIIAAVEAMTKSKGRIRRIEQLKKSEV